MGYDNSRMRREIGQYLHSMQERGLCEIYIKQNRGSLLKFLRHCADRGVHSTKKISREDVQTFHEKYAGQSAAARLRVYSTVRQLLLFCENMNALKYRPPIRGRTREHVDWLLPSEAEEVLDFPMTLREAVIITAGLMQGFRRVETSRITVGSAQKALESGVLSTLGKGDKYRSVPLHPRFREVLKAYLEQLPDQDPDRSLLGITRGTVGQACLDFSRRFGRKFSTHTLRRTFGRNLWLLGIPIETIAELMGHSSTDMTRLYLGLNVSDMRKAISEYGTKSQLRIIEKAPCRRIAPRRPEPDQQELESMPIRLKPSSPTGSLPPDATPGSSCEPSRKVP